MHNVVVQAALTRRHRAAHAPTLSEKPLREANQASGPLDQGSRGLRGEGVLERLHKPPLILEEGGLSSQGSPKAQLAPFCQSPRLCEAPEAGQQLAANFKRGIRLRTAASLHMMSMAG